MGWEKWQQIGKKLFDSVSIVEPFQVLAVTLLTLLLPLSFLLLSRFVITNYLLSLAPSSQTGPYSIPIFLFFHIIPTILFALVSLMSSLTLVHTLTGHITLISRSPEPLFKLPLYASWFLLCSFQVCVGLGIEGSIPIGINGLGFSHKISLVSRVVFFLGLHETMTYWLRMVVKPLVDNTILGFWKEERWTERVALAVGFGWLWWWRLRGEVESLVIMVEVKKQLMMGIGLSDFIGWWLYYLTVTIGMVKFAKLSMWLALILLFNRVEQSSPSIESSIENDEKV